jgi:drug/metabolite transporter (DMT)-like permease
MAPVGEVTLLFTTSPLFIVVYKSVIRSPIKRSEAFGMLLATVGVSLILLPRLSIGKAASWQIITGYFLALGAAGLVALYASWLNVLAKQGIAPKSINVVFVTFVFGSILSLLCAIYFSKVSIGSGMSRQVILIFSGLGILSTALPFLCYTVAARRLPVMLSTAILLLEPMFAVLFASVALQEIPSLWFGIGSLLVCGGLLSIAREGSSL